MWQTELDLERNGATRGYKNENLRPECLSVDLQLVWGNTEARELPYTKLLRGHGDLGLSSHHGFYQLSGKISANQ